MCSSECIAATSTAGSMSEMTAMMLTMSSSHFSALPENPALYTEQYNVMAGTWPQKYNECVVVLSSDGSISDLTLYAIGLKDIKELDDILKKYAEKGEADIDSEASTYKYEDFIGIEFKLVDPTSIYQYDKKHDIYVNKSDDKEFMLKQIKNGETLRIVGVVKPDENANAAMLMSGINYLSSLTTHIIETAQKSKIVEQQKNKPDINIFTGNEFGDDEASFDMESLFKIDENALDMTALAGDLDMSSMFSGMDMSQMMGALDLSSAFENMDMSEILGDVDMSQAFENMDLYIENGCNIIDTARLYVDGKSEEIIGEYLKERKLKNKIVISTKAAHPPLGYMEISRLSKEEIEKDVDTSLSLLGVDAIDILWLHRDDHNVPVEDITETMATIIKKGKVKYWGVSNWQGPRMEKANEYAALKGLPKIFHGKRNTEKRHIPQL